MEKLPDKIENSYWSFRQPIAAQDMHYSSACLMEKLPDMNENSYWSFRQPIAAQDMYLPDGAAP
jgi:hypothetical protein